MLTNFSFFHQCIKEKQLVQNHFFFANSAESLEHLTSENYVNKKFLYIWN